MKIDSKESKYKIEFQGNIYSMILLCFVLLIWIRVVCSSITYHDVRLGVDQYLQNYFPLISREGKDIYRLQLIVLSSKWVSNGTHETKWNNKFVP